MFRILIASFALILIPLATRAQDRVFSGPQPGEKLTPFRVIAHAGPRAGKEITLIPKDHKGVTLLIFVHEITRPGLQLIKPVDLYAGRLAKDGLSAHFVWLTADKSKTEAFFNRAKGTLRKLKVPYTISLDGQEGPGNYGLNRKMTLTFLVAKDRKVTANFAIIQPNETDAPKILAALAKAVGKKRTPTLASLQKDLGAGRSKKKAKRPKKGKGAKTPPELGTLMRQLIQKTNTEADVKKTIGEIEKWAGKDRKKWAHVRRIGNIIIRQQYGTEPAQTAVKKLIEKK